jgi:competence protein ComEA
MYATLRIRLALVLALLLSSATAPAWAVGDVNRLEAGRLQAVKGIGPKMSQRIVEERQRSPFRDWDDFIDRMPGVGERTARKFSAQGLTVNGQSFGSTPANARTPTRNSVTAYAPRTPPAPPPESATLRR